MIFKYGWNKTNISYMCWRNTELFIENRYKLFELAIAYRKDWVFWQKRATQNLDKKTFKRVLRNEIAANKLWRLCWRAYKNNDFIGGGNNE